MKISTFIISIFIIALFVGIFLAVTDGFPQEMSIEDLVSSDWMLYAASQSMGKYEDYNVKENPSDVITIHRSRQVKDQVMITSTEIIMPEKYYSQVLLSTVLWITELEDALDASKKEYHTSSMDVYKFKAILWEITINGNKLPDGLWSLQIVSKRPEI